ncbi:hypothetical protein FRC20_011394 [Serendipita sp. 405]|nr:hypothetical protein FRC20_011394 [Serendipita sp. 405]
MPPKSHFVALEGPDFDREHAEQLAVRLDLLPYTTESEQQANDLLETFIAKLIASTNAKDADSIVQWGVEAMQEYALTKLLLNGILITPSRWSVLRRSISRPRRAVLVRFFYHLTIVPGLKRKYMRSFTSMIRQLSFLQGDGRRLIDSHELILDWRPLWSRFKGEIFNEGTVSGQLIELAWACKEYFPIEQIPNMLEEFMPLLNPETAALVAAIMSAFIPTAEPRRFLPLIFQMAESFSSPIMWLYFVDLLADATERHMIFSSSQTAFKDVGMFTASEWELLVSRLLTGHTTQLLPFETLVRTDRLGSLLSKLRKPAYQPDAIAQIVIYSISVDGPIKESTEVGDKQSTNSPKYVAGSKALESLAQFITSKEVSFHPSQSSSITRSLTAMTESLSRRFIYRWTEEASGTCKTPKVHN